MYAVLPSKATPSKSLSTDQTRPVLTHAELRRTPDNGWELVTCDSYQLARVPLSIKDPELEPELTPGPISTQALKAIEKSRGFRANGTVEPVDTYGTPTGMSFARPDPGKFPNWDSLEPDYSEPYTITINPKLLAALAASLGASLGANAARTPITLEIDTSVCKDGWQSRPILVRAGESRGMLMPIRPTGK